MRGNIFLPNFNRDEKKKDSIRSHLSKFSNLILIITFGLLPLWFLPFISVPLWFTKTYFVLIGVFIFFVSLSLAVFRKGFVKLYLPWPLWLFLGFVSTATLSALLSGDKLDAFLGDYFEIYTVGFFILFWLVLLAGFIFGRKKKLIKRLFFAFSTGVFVLLLIQVLRLFLGAKFLSFSVFTVDTQSYLGSFNDLALLSGLVTVSTLLLLQIKRENIVITIYTILTLLMSLSILMVVNFYFVWLMVAVFSVVILLYYLSSDTWSLEKRQNSVSKLAILTTVFTILLSVLFVLFGDRLGNFINEKTGITYLEVSPSFSTTVDLTNEIYSKDLLLGVGPNRFVDGWRLYKNSAVNETEFWSTEFTAGNGFVPTVFATTGLLGGIMFVLFLLSLLYIAYKTLFSSNKIEEENYNFATMIFLIVTYLWVMTFIYVPSSSILLITAMATGLAIAIYVNFRGDTKKAFLMIDVRKNNHHRLLLIISLLAFNVSILSGLYFVSKQYLAQDVYIKTFSEQINTKMDFIRIDDSLLKAQSLFMSDIFLAERAKLRLAMVNEFVGKSDPTLEEEAEFREVLAEGIALSKKAIELDYTNPHNHSLLASFYLLLNPEKNSEIWQRKENEITEVLRLDPTNPSHYLLFAQLNARFGNLIETRNYLEKAIALKNNYTEALYLSTQLDIAEGNGKNALVTARSIANLEPYNPTRQFQLGVLLLAEGSLDEAISVLIRAIEMDTNYANARYFLALAYLDKGEKDMALEQLVIIKEDNPNNEQLNQLIEQVRNDNFRKPISEFTVPLEDGSLVNRDESVTVTEKQPKTDLITTLNQGGESEASDNLEQNEGGVIDSE